MRIEDIEALASARHDANGYVDDGMVIGKLDAVLDEAIQALRSEAWHPIEKAEELGAHTGEIAVLGYGDWGGVTEWFPMIWEGKFWTSSGDFVSPTHFRFINPPEGA